MKDAIETHLEGCLKNDPRSQEDFYNFCFERLMKICLRYHANYDDAMGSFNNAMLKVFNKLSQYRNEGHILAWVSRIITNTCLNELKRKAAYESREISEEECSSFTADPDIYRNITEKELLGLVQQLPESTRLVFNLFIMEGYTHKQIANELMISEGTSKWHLNHARKTIREKFYKLNELNTK